MSAWGEQYSVGDQGSNRKVFWANGMASCPLCNSTEVECERDCAGCRNNGDGYGTEVYTCKSCDWKTSFQYDEASDTYFYETRHWNIPPPVPTEIVFVELTDALKEKYKRVRQVIGEAETRLNMKEECIRPEDIDAFIAEWDAVKKRERPANGEVEG